MNIEKPIVFNYNDYLGLLVENEKLKELLALATEVDTNDQH